MFKELRFLFSGGSIPRRCVSGSFRGPSWPDERVHPTALRCRRRYVHPYIGWPLHQRSRWCGQPSCVHLWSVQLVHAKLYNASCWWNTWRHQQCFAVEWNAFKFYKRSCFFSLNCLIIFKFNYSSHSVFRPPVLRHPHFYAHIVNVPIFLHWFH